MRLGDLGGIWETYRLLREVSSINGFDVEKPLLDRVMFNAEELPPLGKEYWWFLFFDGSGEKPVQMMLLIYRKHGGRMLFNDKEMELRRLGEDEFLGVTSGWVFDGEKLHDLGDGNVAVHLGGGEIASELSGKKMTLSGGYPDYRLRVGNIIDLTMGKGGFLGDRDARGIFLPPFGMGWVDIYSGAKGIVLDKPFNGTAHLQKVFGATVYGPFHWGRIVFSNGSTTSFFTLKTGEESETYFHRSLAFYDTARGEVVKFQNPRLKITRSEGGWTINGRDGDKELNIVLDAYAEKKFTMKGGGSQVYVEYAVKAREFTLWTGARTVTLKDVGDGVGTIEDAYW
ncbi:MAG: hypothetical protein NTV61_08510 [Candidatus Bathyarchaeota archaeon]|nr:hypothetical protein [Candidatus Bathyarchaeota archaeon]